MDIGHRSTARGWLPEQSGEGIVGSSTPKKREYLSRGLNGTQNSVELEESEDFQDRRNSINICSEG